VRLFTSSSNYSSVLNKYSVKLLLALMLSWRRCAVGGLSGTQFNFVAACRRAERETRRGLGAKQQRRRTLPARPIFGLF